MTKVNVKIVVVAKREKNFWAGEILHEVNKQYDVMKTSHARAYCTRLFNKELDNHTHEPSTVIAATYYADGTRGNGGSAGRLAGREGKVLSRTGIFDQ